MSYFEEARETSPGSLFGEASEEAEIDNPKADDCLKYK